MSQAEQNKAIFRSFPEKIFNTGNVDLIDELMHPDIVDHATPPGVPEGREGLKIFVTELRNAFPDYNSRVLEIMADGDERVGGRIENTGTHSGTFMGIPPTGKKITWTESHWGRIVDGMLIEHWMDADNLSLLTQLGAIPEQQPAAE